MAVGVAALFMPVCMVLLRPAATIIVREGSFSASMVAAIATFPRKVLKVVSPVSLSTSTTKLVPRTPMAELPVRTTKASFSE